MDNLHMDFVEGGGVINATIDLVGARFVPEEMTKPRSIVKPVGADKLSIEQVVPVINDKGIFTKEVVVSREVHFERQLELFGEEFVISEGEDKHFCIFHRTWPLSGDGRVISEAIEDLRETIHDLKNHYAHTTIDHLDGRAVVFREFLFSLNV